MVKKVIILIAVLMGAVIVVSGFSSAGVHSPASGGWPMQRGDIYGRAQSQYDATSNAGKIAWSFDTYGTPQGAPVIGPDGTVYVSTDLCLEGMKDGKETLKYMLTADTSRPVHSSTPAIAQEGSVYIASDQGRELYAIKDGGLNWTFDFQYPWFPSPILIAPDGSIYFGASSQMTALTPSGDLKWKATASYDITARPVMSGNTIYFVSRNSAGNVNATLYAMDASSGKMLWKWNNAYDIVSTPAVSSNGTVFFAATDAYPSDNAYLFGVLNNKTVMKVRIGDTSLSSPAIDRNGNIYIGSGTPASGEYSGKLLSFHPNGTRRWSVDLSGNVGNVILDSSGNAFVPYYGDGTYLASIGADGKLRWTISLGRGNAFEAAIGADGTIYVATTNNMLFAIGENSDNGDMGGGGDDTGTGDDTGNETGGNDSTDSSGESSTPGFEALPAVISIGLALLIYRRKRL